MRTTQLCRAIWPLKPYVSLSTDGNFGHKKSPPFGFEGKAHGRFFHRKQYNPPKSAMQVQKKGKIILKLGRKSASHF